MFLSFCVLIDRVHANSKINSSHVFCTLCYYYYYVLVVSKFAEVVKEINMSKRRIEETIGDVWEKMLCSCGKRFKLGENKVNVKKHVNLCETTKAQASCSKMTNFFSVQPSTSKSTGGSFFQPKGKVSFSKNDSLSGVNERDNVEKQDLDNVENVEQLSETS